MFSHIRLRAFLAPALTAWVVMIPLAFHLAAGTDPPSSRTRVVAETAATASPPSTLAPRLVAPTKASRAAPRPAVFVARDGTTLTAARLRSYLRRQGSPMAAHASTLLAAGITHKMDPRSVIAIAGAESSFGVYMPCYNAWGWGGGVCRWGSWSQAINNYTRLVADAYPSLRRGDFRTAGKSYNPGNWEQWASRCRAYFNAI